MTRRVVVVVHHPAGLSSEAITRRVLSGGVRGVLLRSRARLGGWVTDRRADVIDTQPLAPLR